MTPSPISLEQAVAKLAEHLSNVCSCTMPIHLSTAEYIRRVNELDAIARQFSQQSMTNDEATCD